ncbi:MAG TPA: hypothetical protein VIA64_07070 [Burkholderiales bacterium]|jgi:hypothetical protein
MSRWKKTIVIPALAVALGTPPVLALDQEQIRREPTEGEILADGLIARPLALISTVIGAVAFVVTLPFTVPSKTTDRAAEKLVAKPARYAFKRPIGQLDSCETLPETCR